MIRIVVVRMSSGLYIGRTFSDRWNLMTLRDLGREEGLQLDINKCMNKGQIDRLRRTLKGMGFALSVRKAGNVGLGMTRDESRAMLGAVIPIYRPERRDVAA